MSEWYERSYLKRIDEARRLRLNMRITIYGSFNPDSEKERLMQVVHFLRNEGFEDTDVVEGNKRPNPWGLNKDDISMFYLEDSDVNFMIFTHNGSRLGVTSELAHILESPDMCEKASMCVVFNEINADGHGAVGRLQIDKILKINAKFNHIKIVDFESEQELLDSVLAHAVGFLKVLGPRLEARL